MARTAIQAIAARGAVLTVRSDFWTGGDGLHLVAGRSSAGKWHYMVQFGAFLARHLGLREAKNLQLAIIAEEIERGVSAAADLWAQSRGLGSTAARCAATPRQVSVVKCPALSRFESSRGFVMPSQ